MRNLCCDWWGFPCLDRMTIPLKQLVDGRLNQGISFEVGFQTTQTLGEYFTLDAGD